MNQGDQIKKNFDIGKDLVERGRYKAACLAFQKAADIAPPSADLLIEWGSALFGKSDFAGAVEKCRKALRLEPRRAEAHVLWGNALCKLDRYHESEKRYEKAVSIEPGNTKAYSGWALALHEQGKWKQTVEMYKKVIEADPNEFIYPDLTSALEQLESTEKAKVAEELETWLTSDPRYAVALTNWGYYLEDQKQHEEAMTQFRKACNADPAYADPHVGLGSVFQHQGKYADALNSLLRAIELDPGSFNSFVTIDEIIQNLNEEESANAFKKLVEKVKDARFFSGWGWSLLRRKRYADAIDRFKRAHELDPQSEGTLLGWGGALARQSKLKEAILKYSQAAKINPSSTAAFCRWAHALSSLGIYSEAAERYQHAIAIDPASVDFDELFDVLEHLEPEKRSETLQILETELAKRHTAGLYIKWGDELSRRERNETAIAKYEEALKIDEKASNAWRQRAAAQMRLGDYSKAIESYRKVTEFAPYDWEAYVDMGDALCKEKRLADARETYHKAADLADDPSEVYFKSGVALHKQRNYKEAIESYKKVLEDSFHYAYARINSGSILTLLQKYDEAVEQYREALKKDPKNAMAHCRWGFSLAAQQKYDEAIEQFKKAIALQNDFSFYLDWGNVLDLQGRAEEAIGVCQQAIDINKDYAYAYHNIAYYLWEQGDYRAGYRAWEDACNVYARTAEHEKKKGNADFFHYYGTVLYQYFGNLEKSEYVLKEGLAIDVDHTGILGTLMGLYLERHNEPSKGIEIDAKRPSNYVRARQYFRRAELILKQRVELTEDISALQELGDLYLNMGQHDDAKTCLKGALEKGLQSPALYASLGVLWSRKEDFRRAAHFFEEAHRRDQNDLNLWSNLAEVYLKRNPKDLKQIDMAEKEYRRILKIAPDHIDSLIGMGEVYTAMAEVGDKDSYEIAIRHYGQAIQLAEKGKGSKRLKTKDLAALHHSLGYARVKFYEAAKPFGDKSLLKDALNDFCRCADLDAEHSKAEVAKGKLDKLLSKHSQQWFAERFAPWMVLIPSLFVLITVQFTYFFNVLHPREPMGVTSYIALTFGSLIFVVVGLFLPEIHKLKGAGIELEKGPVTQISTSGSLNIGK